MTVRPKDGPTEGVAVLVLIKVEGEAPGRGLLPWLTDDPVAEHATFSTAPGRPDEMGTGEVIQAVFDGTIDISGLVVATAAWWDARRRRTTPLTITIERDGIRTTVTGSDQAEIDRIVRTLTEGDPPPPVT